MDERNERTPSEGVVGGASGSGSGGGQVIASPYEVDEATRLLRRDELPGTMGTGASTSTGSSEHEDPVETGSVGHQSEGPALRHSTIRQGAVSAPGMSADPDRDEREGSPPHSSSDLPPHQHDPGETLILPAPPAGGRFQFAEPPTIENPGVEPGKGQAQPEDEGVRPGQEVEGEDDIGAWSALQRQGDPRFQGSSLDWEEPEYSEYEPVGETGDERRVRAFDAGRAAPSDLFSFEDSDLDEEPEPESPPQGPNERSGQGDGLIGAGAGERQGGLGRNLGNAVVTGVAAAVLLLGALALFHNAGGMVVVIAAIALAAAEFFTELRAKGFRPATLLGVVGSGALAWAAYARGEAAFPLVTALFVVFVLLWYLAKATDTKHPTMSAGVSLLGFAYIGVLGSFAALLLRWPPAPAHGVGLFLGALIGGVAYDLGGFLTGRRLGRTPLAPEVSPHKTWEGLLGGFTAALLACLLIVAHISPWSGKRAFALGLVVAIVAPLGDLCESMLKRDLGVKDIGHLLPGHGGVLDRVDALLFVIPATYFLAQLLKIT